MYYNINIHSLTIPEKYVQTRMHDNVQWPPVG